MKATNRSYEPVILLCSAFILLALSRQDLGYWAASRAPVLSSIIDGQICFPFGVLFSILAFASYLLSRQNTSLWRLAGSQKLPRITFHRCEMRAYDWLWLVAAISLGVAVRLSIITLPIRYDEAFTFLHFASGTWRNVFYYPLPNNHVLYTLFVHVAWSLMGGSLFSIRLPALLCSIAAIPVAFLLARELGGKGRLTVIGMALFPYLVFYGAVARGYSLLVLLILVLTLLLSRDKPLRESWLSAAMISGLAVFTVPTALFPIAGIVLWAVVKDIKSADDLLANVRHFLLPYCMAAGLLCLLLYTPVFVASGGGLFLVDSRFVAPLPWAEFLKVVLPSLERAATELSKDSYLLVILFCLAGCFASLACRRMITLLLCLIAGAGALLIATRAIPYARTWIYWIPFVLIASDVGWSKLMENAKSPADSLTGQVLAVVLLSGLAWNGFSASYAQYKELGLAPQAKDLAQRAAERIRGLDILCAPLPLDEPIKYYLQKDLSRDELLRRGAADPVLWLFARPAKEGGAGQPYRLLREPPDWAPGADFHGTCSLVITNFRT